MGMATGDSPRWAQRKLLRLGLPFHLLFRRRKYGWDLVWEEEHI
jgi:hypothetical protein